MPEKSDLKMRFANLLDIDLAQTKQGAWFDATERVSVCSKSLELSDLAGTVNSYALNNESV